VVTNPTMVKAMCATCLLACVVQVWSSEAVVDGEVKVKGECHADGPGAVKGGCEAWTEGPGGRVTSRGG
jgi:hypothetical protein